VMALPPLSRRRLRSAVADAQARPRCPADGRRHGWSCPREALVFHGGEVKISSDSLPGCGLGRGLAQSLARGQPDRQLPLRGYRLQQQADNLRHGGQRRNAG